MSIGGWLDSSNISNKLKQTYVQGFVDITGNLIVRNGNMIGFYDLSLNGNANIGGNANVNQKLFVGGDISANGNLNLAGNLAVNSNITTNGNISLNGHYLYTQSSSIVYDYIQQSNRALTISDASQLNFNINGTSMMDISSTGLSILNGNVSLNGQCLYTQSSSATNNYIQQSSGALTLSDAAHIQLNISGVNYLDISSNGLNVMGGNVWLRSRTLYTYGSSTTSNNSYIKSDGSNTSISDTQIVFYSTGSQICLVNNAGFVMTSGNVYLNNRYLCTSGTNSYIYSTGTNTTIRDTGNINLDISNNGNYANINISTAGLTIATGNFILNNKYMYTSSATSTNSYIVSASGITSISDTSAIMFDISGNPYAMVNVNGWTFLKGNFILNNKYLYTSTATNTNSYLVNNGSGTTTWSDTIALNLNINGFLYAIVNSSGLTISKGNLYVNNGTIYTNGTTSTNSFIKSNGTVLTLSDANVIQFNIGTTTYANLTSTGLFMQNGADIILNGNYLYTNGTASTNSFIQSDGSTLTVSDAIVIQFNIGTTTYANLSSTGLYIREGANLILDTGSNIILNNNYLYTNGTAITNSFIQSDGSTLTVSDTTGIQFKINGTQYANLSSTGLFMQNSANIILNNNYLYTNGTSSTNSYIRSNGSALIVSDTTGIQFNICTTTYANLSSTGLFMQNGADIILNKNYLYTNGTAPTNSFIQSDGYTLIISDTTGIQFNINGTQYANLTSNGMTIVAGNLILNNKYLYTSSTSSTNSYIQSTSGTTTIRDTTKIYVNIGGTNVIGVDSSSVTIAGNVNALSYNATSDRRLKTNIRTLGNQWQNIKRVIPSEYEWKSSNRSDYGFVAQQLHEVYPHLRKDFSETIDPTSTVDEPVDLCGNPLYYTVDYGKMTPYLWKGMQEIMEVVETQNVKLREQSLEIESLKAQLANIHKVLGIA